MIRIFERTIGLTLRDYVAWLEKEEFATEAKELKETCEKARLREFLKVVFTKLTEIERKLGEKVLGYEPVDYTKSIP
jgi:hypothetical protein